MNKPLVSIIIIDYKQENPYLLECLNAIGKQTYKNYEIILLTDYKNLLQFPKLRKKHYGKPVSPAKKRNDGVKISQGEIISFIDDDAHPHKNWLKKIARHFNESNITAVGGPGTNPQNIPFMEAASGWFSASPLGAGIYTYRFLPTKQQFVDDYPSMNLSVLKKDFLKVGGYDPNYYPGEDTKLCLDLISQTNKKIIYDPQASVFHHRRPLWISHLKQNGNFGLHRGFFARVLPQTSFRPIYFGPTLLALGLPFIFLPLVNPTLILIQNLGQVLLIFYLSAIILNSAWIGIKSKSISHALISIPAVFITHYWYGLKFLQGFFLTRKLGWAPKHRPSIS